MSEEPFGDETLDCIDQSTQKSFWEVGKYRRVVKRIDDGAKLCFDFVKMVHERAEIEAKYSKHLQQWSRKWEENIGKGPEYGSLENGWKTMLYEGQRQSEIHNLINKELNSLANVISEWRISNYHKGISGQYKETKRSEEGFSKAQKPWEKALQSCNKAKKAFHQTWQDLDYIHSLLTAADNASNEMTVEQLHKLNEKREKLEKEYERSQEKYQKRLTEVLQDKPRYVEEMKQEFQRCQEFEKQRLDFFRTKLLKMKDIVDLSLDERLIGIYQVCNNVLSSINANSDLEWFSQQYGPDMSYTWPTYEEYKQNAPEENRKISNCSVDSVPRAEAKSNSSSSSHEVATDDKTSKTLPTSLPDNKSKKKLTPSSSLPPPPPHPNEAHYETIPVVLVEPTNKIESHIYESADFYSKDALPPSQLQMMRALYTFVGEDEDDLSFNEGDIVRIVEFCDGGWAKALLGREYGYIPVAFFEVIS